MVSTTSKGCGLDVPSMDANVDRKQDFYQYSNGNWADEIPGDRAEWGPFHQIRETTLENLHHLVSNISSKDNVDPSTEEGKISLFWRSAMDLESIESQGIQPLADFFSDIEAMKYKNDFIELAAKFHRSGIKLLMNVGAEADMKDSDSTIVWIGASGLGLPSREYYFDEDKLEKRKAYVKHIETIFHLAGIADAEEKAKIVFDLEKGIASVSKTNIENQDFMAMYNPRTLAELPKEWDWQRYFDIVGKDCVKLEDCKMLCVTSPKQLDYVSKVITDDNIEDWKIYAKWHVLLRFKSYLPQAYVKADFEFYKKGLTGQTEMQDRWKQMISCLNGNLGELLGKVYCDNFFPASSKNEMLKLVDNVLGALKEMLRNLDWMTAETKTEALNKLDGFQVKIGYPDKFVDYFGLILSPEDSFISIICKMAEFEHVRGLKEANQPTNREKWGMAPQEVNACYEPLRNEILFPAAILQGASFDPNRDICVNYGAIGAIIGHECTHGFDDQGRGFDGKGDMRNWWTDKDTESFDNKKQKIIDEYDKIEVLPNKFVNGTLTQGENIADIGGLKCAYNAMQKALIDHPEANKIVDGYSPSQRFFLAWAQFWRTKARDGHLQKQIATDPHSPGKVRSTAPCQHLAEFYDAFDIKEGDAMYLNPELRGNVW